MCSLKVLVTGAKGMLGNDICQVLKASHQVVATDVEEMDIRDYALVFEILHAGKPDLVVHLAGITDMDTCEKDPDLAYSANTLGTKNVALACQRVKARMLYLSTLAVFDGTKCEPYTEFDRPNPQSHYGKSKYQGELLVRDFLQRFYVVRTGWLFGGDRSDRGFVSRTIHLARQSTELKLVDDRFGSPTYTRDLSLGIMRLIETDLYGTYHLVNRGRHCSEYQLAQMIVEYADARACRLVPCSSAEFPTAAPRPRMEAGHDYCLQLMGLPLMRRWQDALKEYIETVWTES